MKDSRIGESLWSLWEGEGYNSTFGSSILYYTDGHVDLDHEVVKKALASSIQRDGITYSLFEAFNLIDNSLISQGWGGLSTGEIYQEICDADGTTASGSTVYDLTPITFVEVPDLA